MERVKDNRAAVWQHSIPMVLRNRSAQQQAIWAVYSRELQELSESFRFRAVAFLIVAIMVLSAVIHAQYYHNEVKVYESTWRAYVASLEGASLGELVQAPYPAMKPPWELAFLANGGQRHSPDVYEMTLTPWELPELNNRQRIDERLHPAESLDWAFFIRVVLSMSAFLLGYDVVCGRRQRAALKIVLSYAVDRWVVMMVKILALFTCVSLPFLVGAFLSVLTLTTVGGLKLDRAEMGKVLLMVVLGLWASGLFVLMAAFVSLVAREAGRSLTVLTLVWVLAVVVIPAAGGLLAHRIQPLRTERAIEQELNRIRRDHEEIYGGSTWRSLPVARQDGFDKEIESAKIEKERYDLQIGFLLTVLEEQFEQVALARKLTLMSPMMMIQGLAEEITGSGIARDRTFIEQVWIFRSDLEEAVQELDGQDQTSPGVCFFPKYMSQTVQVEARDLRKFSFREVGAWEGIRGAGVRLLLLSLVTVVLLVAVLMGFASYEVG
jgi:hypothetical protein